MFSLLLFFIMVLVSLATATPIATRAPDLDNLDLATFKITYNGQDYILKGTIQKVVAQMDVLHPGFAANLTAKINKDRSLSDRAKLNKRDMELPPYCIPVPGWSWGNAASYWILEDGVPYLNGLQYELLAQPGPGWCTQISCNWNSGIYWCNDNAFSFYLNGETLGNYAEELCQLCESDDGVACGGQLFDNGFWNIIVREDSC